MRFEKSREDLKVLLLSLGFKEGLEQELCAKICFQPDKFLLSYRLMKEGDAVEFFLEFELLDEDYTCKFYEAVLRKKINFSSAIISDGHLTELDKRMQLIDWNQVSDHESIDAIITDLKLLDRTEEGRAAASLLKLKFWSSTTAENLIPNLSSLKSKYEISQRFYFFDDEAPITIEEAYRFLCNRWREKQILLKKKQEVPAPPVTAESAGVGSASAGDALMRKVNLLPKKKRGRAK